MAGIDHAVHREQVANLFRNHYGWLCIRLRRMMDCPANAEDIASETFLQVLRTPATDPIREPRAFLTTIAKRLVFQSWRRRDLERGYLALLGEQEEAMVPSAEEQVQMIEALIQLDRLLDGLPAKVKATFLLSQVDGLTYPQIAKVLGISQRSVSDYMALAIKRCLSFNQEWA